MFYLLELREKIKKFYQEKESIAISIFKFIISFVIFYTVTRALDYNELLGSILIIFILSMIGAVVPITILTFIVMLVGCLEIFYFSSILGAIAVGIFLIMYCLYIRFTPKYGIAVVAVPIAFVLKMPCLVPIVLGLIATPVTAIAVICGTICYYLVCAVKEVEKIVGTSTEEAGQIYGHLVEQLKENSSIVFTLIVLAFITILVYVIRTREIDYAPEVAIVTGGIVNLLAFLVADLTKDIEVPMSIVSLILGTVGACVVAFIVQYFICALDYSAIERVQFEDDDYYYYVKAVPKMKVATGQNDVKKIQVQKPISQKNSDEDFQVSDIFQDKNWDDIDNRDADFTVVADKMESADIDVVKEFEENIEKDLEKNLEKDIVNLDK